MKQREPTRSPLSAAAMWASRVTSIGLEIAVPALVGVYIDDRWRTKPVATLVGSVLGFAVMMLHIMRIAREGTAS